MEKYSIHGCGRSMGGMQHIGDKLLKRPALEDQYFKAIAKTSAEFNDYL